METKLENTGIIIGLIVFAIELLILIWGIREILKEYFNNKKQ